MIDAATITGVDPRPTVGPVAARDPATRALVDELTAELAAEGYTEDQTFGYSLDQLEERGVVLVGARVGGELVGLGGLEVQDGGYGELKRFYVRPPSRGRGVAAAVLDALVAVARDRGLAVLRLETGDRQHAAIAFYARHGFVDTPRFGPYVDSATSVCLQRTLR
jgi:putative acetyltransferase